MSYRYTSLAQEIYPLASFNFSGLEYRDSDSLEDKLKSLTIIDADSWYIKGKDVKHAFKRYMRKVYPETYFAVQEKFENTFYKTLSLVPPLVVFLIASEKLSVEKFTGVMLEAPKDAKIILNFMDDSEFVESTLFMYKHWQYYNYGSLDTLESIGDTTKEDTKSLKLPALTPEKRATLDHLLTSSFGAPAWSDIEQLVEQSSLGSKDIIEKLDAVQKSHDEVVAKSKRMEEEMRESITRLSKELAYKPFADAKIVGDGTIPDGKITMKSVGEVFPVLSKFNFDIPVWEWDGVHPEVPSVDPFYIFREDLLISTLHAIISNQRMYLQGHTGSGKTTLIEQVAAHLKWPFTRINFDSEITRMDLIGRDTLQDGKSVFVDGMLPRAMSGPYIAVFDELDFCRPDVSYVMQSALEGNGLKITEDGGRTVEPNPYFRMFGTGNTVGQGDEQGMYQGARPQSLAFLDRFTIWAKVPYLDSKQRTELLTRHYPGLTGKEVGTIIKYSTEHLTAFEESKVLQPISPRGILAIANATMFFNTIQPSLTMDNVRKALIQTVLDRATEADGAVLKGLVDRVLKS